MTGDTVQYVMKIEAHQLRIAHIVRLPSGDGEVVRRQDFRNQVRVWFQGHEHRAVFDIWEILEVQRPATTLERENQVSTSEQGPLAAEVQPERGARPGVRHSVHSRPIDYERSQGCWAMAWVRSPSGTNLTRTR